MRLFLLSIFSIFLMNYATAQYTLTNEEGDNVENGSTVCAHMDAKKSMHKAELTLHSSLSGDFVFEIVSSNNPEGTFVNFCLNPGTCYPPTQTSATGSLNADNENFISIDYVNSGDNSDVDVCCRIYKEGDPSVSIEFCARFTAEPCATGIEEKLSNVGLCA